MVEFGFAHCCPPPMTDARSGDVRHDAHVEEPFGLSEQTGKYLLVDEILHIPNECTERFALDLPVGRLQG